MAIHMHSLDKAELTFSLHKAKQVSDNQGKLYYNKIILIKPRKKIK